MTGEADLYAAVSAWLAAQSPRVVQAQLLEQGPTTTHLDTLVGRRVWRSREALALACRAFDSLIIAAQRAEDTRLPELRLPLQDSLELETAPPSKADIIEQLDPTEPPSLYLWDEGFFSLPWPCERYVYPMDVSEFCQSSISSSTYAYYSAYRSLEDVRRREPYQRNLHITAHVALKTLLAGF